MSVVAFVSVCPSFQFLILVCFALLMFRSFVYSFPFLFVDFCLLLSPFLVSSLVVFACTCPPGLLPLSPCLSSSFCPFSSLFQLLFVFSCTRLLSLFLFLFLSLFPPTFVPFPLYFTLFLSTSLPVHLFRMSPLPLALSLSLSPAPSSLSCFTSYSTFNTLVFSPL